MLGGLVWVVSNSDYKAISVQLQLHLPAGTEFDIVGSKNFLSKSILGLK